ncbi:Lactaldehyde dehydrogenase [termite gut metagenome]|uniref:Lactaldehyde dehydrogenase n=1 Tax=termite gut metagenome TaxID=433724 RepID=A0A5J4QLG9_9ZZZZ
MKAYQQFINGSLTDSHSSDWIEVENPYTGEIISCVPKGDDVDAYAALEAAKKSQTAWAAQPAAQRAGYLRQMAALISANRLELEMTLASEQAKILP